MQIDFYALISSLIYETLILILLLFMNLKYFCSYIYKTYVILSFIPQEQGVIFPCSISLM